MNFREEPAVAAFRAQFRAWLADNLPKGWRPGHASPDDRWDLFGQTWERKLCDGGWSGVSWPVEYGGRGVSRWHEAVLLEELARAGVPESAGLLGKTMLGPALMIHGTVEQRKRLLPAILMGDDIWCQGFSEPNAGSDLASLATRMAPAASGWQLHGQKIWTSNADRADKMFVLVRSDPAAERHVGLSMVFVDLHGSGVSIRPIHQIDGEHDFCEVFFDGAPVDASNVLGAIGDGWRVALTILSLERGVAHFGRHVRFEQQLRRLVDLASRVEIAGHPAVRSEFYRQRLAQAIAEVELYRLLAYRHLADILDDPSSQTGSVVKVFWSEMYQRIQRLAVDLLGTRATETVDGARFADDWISAYLNSLGRTIAGGTSEIQRNIVAERVLGLPR